MHSLCNHRGGTEGFFSSIACIWPGTIAELSHWQPPYPNVQLAIQPVCAPRKQLQALPRQQDTHITQQLPLARSSQPSPGW